jgi:predicted SprT family Zn-dependent metalloprotease
MNAYSNPNQDTIKISPNHLYICKQHSLRKRSQVIKDRDGKYFCSECKQPVRRAEDSDTGREILRW